MCLKNTVKSRCLLIFKEKIFKKIKIHTRQYLQKLRGVLLHLQRGCIFTPEILENIREKGVKIVYITLNVGLGTFLPVKENNILDHKMHTESFEIPQDTADIINEAKISGKNIVAVGTTVTRTLEAVYKKIRENFYL